MVCPWHGGKLFWDIVARLSSHVACFNVCTGDIEDAPGLDSLWSFNATVKNGKIVVSANEKEVKSKVGRVAAKIASKPEGKETVVIVGGGSGAIHTIESLRMVSPF